jgi:hypothetical protein
VVGETGQSGWGDMTVNSILVEAHFSPTATIPGTAPDLLQK